MKPQEVQSVVHGDGPWQVLSSEPRQGPQAGDLGVGYVVTRLSLKLFCKSTYFQIKSVLKKSHCSHGRRIF